MDIDSKPSLQVIVLGSGGGPLENNITAFLVRSVTPGWPKGSVVAVDAGVHLASIVEILTETQPKELGQSAEYSLPHVLQHGPFAGLEVHSASPSVNAGQLHRDQIDTYLITHPHLDHISGFVINTAGLTGTRVKRLAGLPSTISAFKNHIFNNIIWPNLSDENHGAGLLTYMRLNEGGVPTIGEGDGYMELSDGIAIKAWGVSHGHCVDRHSHRGSGSSNARFPSLDAGVGSVSTPRGLTSSFAPYTQQPSAQQQQQHSISQGMRSPGMKPSPGPSVITQGMQTRSASMHIPGGNSPTESICVYDSSAYFIQDVQCKREVLIFGDVEPDSVSLSPRNLHIWQEAAPKIVAGKLAAIFIECSYDDSRSVERLFGHLTPRFIMEELVVLAGEVGAAKAAHRKMSMDITRASIKRKREGQDDLALAGRLRNVSRSRRGDRPPMEEQEPVSPKTTKKPLHRNGSQVSQTSEPPTPAETVALRELGLNSSRAATFDQASKAIMGGSPLKGIKVVIIHIKDKMADGRQPQAQILEELQQHEAETQLGVEFVIAEKGQSFMF